MNVFFKEVVTKKFKLSLTQPNNLVLVKNKIIRIKKIYKENNDIFIQGNELRNLETLNVDNQNLDFLNIWCSEFVVLSRYSCTLKLASVENKIQHLYNSSGLDHIFIPLL